MLAPWHRRVCVDRALQNKPRHPPSNPPGVDARLADPEEADPGVQQQQQEALESWSPGLSPFLRVRPDLELREEKRIQSRCDLKKKKRKPGSCASLFSTGATNQTSPQPARSARPCVRAGGRLSEGNPAVSRVCWPCVCGLSPLMKWQQ